MQGTAQELAEQLTAYEYKKGHKHGLLLVTGDAPERGTCRGGGNSWRIHWILRTGSRPPQMGCRHCHRHYLWRQLIFPKNGRVGPGQSGPRSADDLDSRLRGNGEVGWFIRLWAKHQQEIAREMKPEGCNAQRAEFAHRI
jgi:hypothetical protein